MNNDRPLIMTCKIGKFTFQGGTPLPIAKIIRDAVMGQMLNPKQRTMNVTSEEDAYALVRSYDSDLVRTTVFELELHDSHSAALLERALQDLATKARVTGQTITDLARQFNKTKTEIWNLLARERALAAVTV